MTNTKTISKAVLHKSVGMKITYGETIPMGDDEENDLDLVEKAYTVHVKAVPSKSLDVSLRRLIPHYTHILGLTPDKVTVNGVYFDKYKTAIDTMMYRFKVNGAQVFENNDERSVVLIGAIVTPHGDVELNTPKINLDNGKYEFGGELKVALDNFFNEVLAFDKGKITTKAQLEMSL